MRERRLLVTGGSGLVGSAIRSLEPAAVFISSRDYDLTDSHEVNQMFDTHRPTHVIHLAGRVGGVGINLKRPVDFFEDNILINTLVLKYAHEYNVERLVSFMSTCIFPDEVEYPLHPSKMHLGEPHDSNFGYAYAKRMLEVQTRAYNKQYGRSWFTIIPTNVYGPHDNFNLETAHVIPALIHKCYLAKQNNEPWVIWGTGQSVREFIYVDDLAKITMWLLDHYTEYKPILVSTVGEITIASVVSMIGKAMNFEGKIIYDSSKPEGQYRKPSDTTKLHQVLSDFEFTSFEVGINKSVEWFLQNYQGARK